MYADLKWAISPEDYELVTDKSPVCREYKTVTNLCLSPQCHLHQNKLWRVYLYRFSRREKDHLELYIFEIKKM